MYLSELARHLQKERLRPVYVAFGNSPQEMQEALAALRACAAHEGDPTLSIVEFPRDQREPTAVMDTLQNTPLFVARRMIILQDADEFISRARQAIEKYLQHPSSTAVLVMSVQRWDRRTTLAKLVEKVGVAVGCWQPRSEGEVIDWLQRRARSAHKKRLGSEAAQLLADLCANDLSALEAELQKLEIYVGQAAEITAQDVAAGGMGYSAYRPFDLCDKLAAGDRAGALRVVEALLQEGLPAVAFVGTLRSYFRRLLEAKLASESEGLGAAVARFCKIPREQEGFRRQLARFSADDLIKAHRALLEADLEAKTNRYPEKLIVERLLMALMVPAAPLR
jgi:DNA polymerase-3 subunit delta